VDNQVVSDQRGSGKRSPMKHSTEWCDLIRKQDQSIVSISLKRVADRGGADTQWAVDTVAQRATFRFHGVSWYSATDGSIVPNGYDWGLSEIETVEDCRLYEDAIACIVKELKPS
jgi:hypothetical protein